MAQLAKMQHIYNALWKWTKLNKTIYLVIYKKSNQTVFGNWDYTQFLKTVVFLWPWILLFLYLVISAVIGFKVELLKLSSLESFEVP